MCDKIYTCSTDKQLRVALTRDYVNKRSCLNDKRLRVQSGTNPKMDVSQFWLRHGGYTVASQIKEWESER